jgi:hypothetical protein
MKRKVFIFGTIIFTIIVNLLANVIPFNNKTTAQISDQFAVYFVPAGYVFAIWGLIYIGLLAYGYYQLKLSPDKEKDVMKELGEWVIIGCLANSIWLFLWHYEYIVATIFMMALLLVSLLAIHFELKKINNSTRSFFWMVKAPFSLYLGWISVATIANVTDLLFSLGITGGMNASVWAVIMIGVAGVLAIVMIIREHDYIYPSVIIWAIVGIAVRFSVVTDIVATVILTSLTIAFCAVITKKKQKDEEGQINSGAN